MCITRNDGWNVSPCAIMMFARTVQIADEDDHLLGYLQVQELLGTLHGANTALSAPGPPCGCCRLPKLLEEAHNAPVLRQGDKMPRTFYLNSNSLQLHRSLSTSVKSI